MLPVIIQNSKDRLLRIFSFDKLPLNLKSKYIRNHPKYAMRKLQFFKLKKVLCAILDNIDLGTSSLCRRNTMNNNRWHATEEKIAKDSGISLQSCRRVLKYLKDSGYLFYKRTKGSKVRIKFLTASFFVHFFNHSYVWVKEQFRKFKQKVKTTSDELSKEQKLLSIEREKGIKESCLHKPIKSISSINALSHLNIIMKMLI